ncbi:unnamed protein product [Echinostoma caproni]|uniref:SH3_10 domain-containing protein n=1 Tax=Echinostoma caproni TaxID=27848 RepID=A0A183AC44_9TREM|nr:unnamed protein product [Echinostoma caproni]
MSSGAQTIETRLSEYERKARAVCIGVNHLALDTERIQQEELLKKVKQLEQELKDAVYQKTNLPQRASDVRNDVKCNSAALRYLEAISQLERSFTVLTENISETSVQLSSPKALSESVHVKKELGGTVQSCWNYVSHLSRLTQVHIRNAAEYHQFHHAVSEVEANLNRRMKLTQPDYARTLPDDLSGCHMLANELREHLNHMINLWARTGRLLEESRRIVPVYLRLGGVKNGLSVNTQSPITVMARTLISLAGPNYELAEGEEVRIISNSDDPHFWKVHTSSGIAEVPSVCLWISDPDLEAVKKAITVREKCIEGWELLVERMRERLRNHYIRLLNRMINDGEITYTNKQMMQKFLQDLDSLCTSSDATGAELKQTVDRFTDRLKLIDRGGTAGRRPSSESGITLREQDIVAMHSPLLRLRDHENQMESLHVQSQFLGQHMTHYLQDIDADRKRLDDELAIMSELQQEHQKQLEHLIGRVRRWSSRYDRKTTADYGTVDSGGTSSLRSSSRSDSGWRMEDPIGHMTNTTSCQTDEQPFHGMRAKSRGMFEAITQTGVVHSDAHMQANLIDEDMIASVKQSRVQEALVAAPAPRASADAFCQIGIIQSTLHTQTDDALLDSWLLQRQKQDAQAVKPLTGKSRDAVCQIGKVTVTNAVQTTDLELPRKISSTTEKTDVTTQIGSMVRTQGTQSEDATVHTELVQQVRGKPVTQALDAATQIQNVTRSETTQADLIVKQPKSDIVDSNVVFDQGAGNYNVSTQFVSTNTMSKQAYSVQTQIGVIKSSQGAQYDMPVRRAKSMETVSCQTRDSLVEDEHVYHATEEQKRLKSVYNVELQTGPVTASKEGQTDVIQEVITLEQVQAQARAPVRNTQDMSVQKSAQVMDVAAQIGFKSHPESIQTDPWVPPRKVAYDVQVQNGVMTRDRQTGADLLDPVKPRSKSYDVLTQVMSTQTEVEHKPTIAKYEFGAQVGFAPTKYDVEAQSGIVSQVISTQTEVERKQIVAKQEVGMQALLQTTKYDVEAQSGIVSQVESIQTEAEIKPRALDTTVESEEMIQVDVVAPVQMLKPETPKDDAQVQAHIAPTKYDVEAQSGIVSQVGSTQTAPEVKEIVPIEDSHVLHTEAAPTPAINKKLQVALGPETIEEIIQTETEYKPTIAKYDQIGSTQTAAEVKPKVQMTDSEVQWATTPAAFDSVIQSEELIQVDVVAPVQMLKPETPKDDAAVQAQIVPAKYDVEMQSGIVSQVGSTQTAEEVKQVTPIEDQSVIHADISPSATINKKLQVALQPQASDANIQAELAPDRYDVEVQSGIVSQIGSTQTAAEDLVFVDVAAPVQAKKQPEQKEIALQASISPEKFNVEAQLGTLTQVSSTQTTIEQTKPHEMYDVESQCGILTTSVAQQTTEDFKDTGVINKKLQVELTPVNTSVVVQTDPEVTTLKPTVQMENVGVQCILLPSRFDVEAQSGVISRVHETQTVLDKKLPAQTDDTSVQWDASIAAFDYAIESDHTAPDAIPTVEVVAPIQAARPTVSTMNVGTQVSVHPDLYNVETQSGVISKSADVQTVQFIEDTRLAHAPSTERAVVNKMVQVSLTPAESDMGGTQSADSHTTTVSYLVRGDRKDFSVQAIVTPDCYDAETEFGRISQSTSTQTEATGSVDDTLVSHRIEKTASQKPTEKKEVRNANLQTDISTVDVASYVVKELQISCEPQLSDAFVQSDIPVVTSYVCAKCQGGKKTEAVSTKNKKFQAYSPGSDMAVQTEQEIRMEQTNMVQAVETELVDSIVTTVSYEEPDALSNKKLQVLTRSEGVNSAVQTDLSPTERTQPDFMLIDAGHQFQSVNKTESLPVQSIAPVTSGVPRSSILINVAQDYTTASRNKKLQVSSFEPEGNKPLMVNKKLQNQAKQEEFGVQTTFENHLIEKLATAETRSVPLIKVDAECQAKVTQFGKKMQFSPVGQEQSCQSDFPATETHGSASITITPATPTPAPTPSFKPSVDEQTMTNSVSVRQIGTEMVDASWISQINIDLVASVQQQPQQRSEQQTQNVVDENLLYETPKLLDSVVQTDETVPKLEATVRTETTVYTTERKSRDLKDSACDAVKPTYVTQILQADAPVTGIEVTPQLQQHKMPTSPPSIRDVSLMTPMSSLQRDSYVMTHIQMEIPTQNNSVQTDPITLEAPAAAPVVQKRHVKIQKGSSWLDSRLTSTETQVDRESPESIVSSRRMDVMDTTESYVHSRNLSSVVGRVTSITSPTSSVRERKPRPHLISWGVQCAPVTLAGVTQTIESETNGRGVGIRPSTTVAPATSGQSVSVQTEQEAQDDDYYIKRVVTTIARRGGATTHRRQAPVVRQVHSRGQANLLTSSLPSNLDEEFLDDEEEWSNPITTKKITTTQVDGSRRMIREELITEEARDRGRSLDSRLAQHAFLSEHELHEVENVGAHEEFESDAENCFRNLLRQWGPVYLMSRLSRQRASSASVDRDLGAFTTRTGRLVGARTQYTSTGSLMAQPTSQYQRTVETQTTGLATQTRPPHKNKRIQRGESYVAWTGSQEFASPGVEGHTTSTRQRSAPPVGMTTTVTETIHEHSTYGIQAMSEEFTCPKCGTSAQFPTMNTLSTQSQSLPITQLRNTPSQTKSLGYYTLENEALTLPVYLSDEEVFRVNPMQELKDDRQFSVVTWCPGDDRDSEKSSESATTTDVPHDEVWVDSPGKLLELQVTGVTVPGTNTVIGAAEAFYRGLLRVVYWDYTKVGPRQSSTELGVAIPLVDAVMNHSVKLATDPAQTKATRTTSRGEQTTPILDAHVVWTTPEMNRSRYVVHAVIVGVPSGGRRTTASQQTEDESATITQPEYLTVKEAIRRGILDAELIHPASPYHTGEEQLSGLHMFSPSHMQQDMDI